MANSLHSGLDIIPLAGGAPKWQTSVGYRWLHSDRHYVGSDYQEERAEEGTQVINDLETIDFGLTYNIDDRWSLSLSVPYVNNDRSSAIRNPAREVVGRSDVTARGIGDIRLSVNYWLWDPSGHLGAVAAEPTGKGAVSTGKGKAPTPNQPASGGRRGNIRISVGVDMPTGEEDAKDYRRVYNAATDSVVLDPVPRIVDQSIQPGDGGWGIPIDIYAYYAFTPQIIGYFQSSYLITPEGNNGVPTGRGGAGEAIMSIGDTWLARAGLQYELPKHGLSFSLGVRTEGQPSEDLFGSSMDFRRPGMNWAVEPGVTWMKNGWSASLLWPIVFYNNRFQSIPDQNASIATGRTRHGDAAFASSYVMFVVGKSF